MDAVYSRVKDLREKVETILLKKIEWRVLFSVDGKRNVADIAEKLDRDATLVEEILQKLSAEKLISGGAPAPAAKPAKEKAPSKKAVKEEVPKAKAEPKPEPKAEPKPEPKIEKAPEPKPVPKKEETDILGSMDSPKVEPKPEPKVEKAAPKPVAPAASASAGGRKILVVDDSIVIQKMVEIALENDNYNLTSAMKGEDAINKAKEMQPSLILLDMMLPDMTGVEVMKALRESGGYFATVPIVVLSGKDSPQDKDAAISNGATDFLNKPFHDEDLLAKVHEYLGK
ncbi:response regulator [bacterium]|nr:response regulator [bacterium]NUN44074.1 response regulator [bacterium]